MTLRATLLIVLIGTCVTDGSGQSGTTEESAFAPESGAQLKDAVDKCVQGSFTFVMIPVGKAPLQEVTQSKAGGLEKDELQKYAISYWTEKEENEALKQAMDKSKFPFKGVKQPFSVKMRPDHLENAFQNTKPSIEMTGLDRARPANKFFSMTMYHDGNAHAKNKPVNERATSLTRAVGVLTKIIYGDAFVARSYDEAPHPWERRDFFKHEVDEEAEWVKSAHKYISSLSIEDVLELGQEIISKNKYLDMKKVGKALTDIVNTHGPVSWRQTDDDVEVVITLPKGAKGKDISVMIKYNLLKVTLKNGFAFDEKDKEITQGDGSIGPSLITKIQNGLHLSRTIDPDISAWSMDEGQVVITLGKKESKTWTDL